jgi:hypothetical protein
MKWQPCHHLRVEKYLTSQTNRASFASVNQDLNLLLTNALLTSAAAGF